MARACRRAYLDPGYRLHLRPGHRRLRLLLTAQPVNRQLRVIRLRQTDLQVNIYFLINVVRRRTFINDYNHIKTLINMVY